MRPIWNIKAYYLENKARAKVEWEIFNKRMQIQFSRKWTLEEALTTPKFDKGEKRKKDSPEWSDYEDIAVVDRKTWYWRIYNKKDPYESAITPNHWRWWDRGKNFKWIKEKEYLDRYW